MEDSLKPVSSKIIQVLEESNDDENLQESPKAEETKLKTSSDIVDVLKGDASATEVAECLQLLANPALSKLDIRLPGPATAQIITVLLSKTLPDFWDHFEEDHSYQQSKSDVVAILRSVPGLGGILARLRNLINEHKQTKATSGSSHQLRVLLQVLDLITGPFACSRDVWTQIASGAGNNPTQRTLVWKEYVSTIASGRLLSTVAEAENMLKQEGQNLNDTWMSDGSTFARWLGQNVVDMVRLYDTSDAASWTAAVQLCTKCLGFGWTGMNRLGDQAVKHQLTVPESFVAALLDGLALEDKRCLSKFRRLILALKTHEQRKLMHTVVSICSSRYLSHETDDGRKQSMESSPLLKGVIALLSELTSQDERLKQHLHDLVTEPQSLVAVSSSAMRRSIIAALQSDEGTLTY